MSWTPDNPALVAELAINHIRLSVIPIVLAFVIAVPLGWVANRNRILRAVTITSGSLLYTIPSLPLFVILPYVLGTRVLSEVNVVVALLIYGVAMMVRSAADALASVDATTRQAATAMGFSSWSRFWRVELPLAGPVLLAGLRVVSVGAIIGSRNLGYLFLNGRQRNNLEEILVGIVASVLIAVVFDLLLIALGRLLMPWHRVSPLRLPLSHRRKRNSLGGAQWTSS